MSDDIKTTSGSTARTFNQTRKLSIPEEAIAKYPDLATSRSSMNFYKAVKQVQTDLGLTVDGMFGRITATQLGLSTIDRGAMLIIDNMPVSIDTGDLFYTRTFKFEPDLDIHEAGNFRARKEDPSFIMLHHGGFDVDHLASVFLHTDRKVSSHFGIGLDDEGKVVVTQMLDLKWVAYHAGKFNEGSIGVDLAMQPAAKYAGKYGFDKVENPSQSGPREVLELPGELVAALAQLVRELHRIYGLTINPVPGIDDEVDLPQIKGDKLTVVGHHHVRKTKWDVGYLWPALLEALSHG